MVNKSLSLRSLVEIMFCTHSFIKRWEFCTPCFKKKNSFENLYTTVLYGVNIVDDEERHAKLTKVLMVNRDSTLNDENGRDSSSMMSFKLILPLTLE